MSDSRRPKKLPFRFPISKSFKLPLEKASSLKQAIFNTLSGRGYEEHQVLRDITFTINKGDFIGIVGRNSSGKSTLLKLMAVVQTTISLLTVSSSFIELGVVSVPNSQDMTTCTLMAR